MRTVLAASMPEVAGALIDHILTNFHDKHRADLASLVPLAERIERVHLQDPDVPQGLAQALADLAREMESHMCKEEIILFPAMRAGGGPGISRPIAAMRAEHEEHTDQIALIRRLTNNLAPPDHACDSWRALYVSTAKFLDELVEHIALENNVLFPKFEQSA